MPSLEIHPKRWPALSPACTVLNLVWGGAATSDPAQDEVAKFEFGPSNPRAGGVHRRPAGDLDRSYSCSPRSTGNYAADTARLRPPRFSWRAAPGVRRHRPGRRGHHGRTPTASARCNLLLAAEPDRPHHGRAARWPPGRPPTCGLPPDQGMRPGHSRWLRPVKPSRRPSTAVAYART